jgi:hypothetical protein
MFKETLNHYIIIDTASCMNLLWFILVMYSHSSVITLYLSTMSKADPLKPPIAYMY